jgi:FixJ family two-component response regulator
MYEARNVTKDLMRVREHTCLMAQMSGTELAQKLLRICPSVRVLFVSEYAGEAILHQRVLDPGINFIQKPFSTTEFQSS